MVDGAYRLFDLFLARYLELMAAATNKNYRVMLVSDHGYLTDELRPNPREAAVNYAHGAYRELGLFAAMGPGVKQDELVFGTMTSDIVPTALAMLDLPISDDLPGKVMTDLFVDNLHVEKTSDADATVPTEFDYDERPNQLTEAWSSYLGELAAQFYIPQPSSDKDIAIEQVQLERLSRLATAYRSEQRHAEAIEVLDSLLAIAPDSTGARYQRAQCALATGDLITCRTVLEDLAKSDVSGPRFDYLRGCLAQREGDVDGATRHFNASEDAVELNLGGQRLLEQIGQSQLAARKLDEAERAFRRALEIDPNSALAHGGLGVTLRGQARYLEAIEHCQRSLAGLRRQPLVLAHLGYAYLALERHDKAADVFREALTVWPEFTLAKEGLQQLGIDLARELVNDRGMS